MSYPIDFTTCTILPNRTYGGKNGSKIGILYNNEIYMLKFPTISKDNSLMHYTNGCISEYVACHIFETLDLPTQKTMLGTYHDKIVVACKDFAEKGIILKDFASLKNTIIDSEKNGYGTELSDILTTIDEQNLFPPKELKTYFWNMFIGDALLGNFDRHNGNWGFLDNILTNEVTLSPIYDCGSCLYPQLTDKQMQHIIQTPSEIEKRLFVFPTSAIKQDDVKLNYANFLLTTNNPDCLNALCTIGSRINLPKIKELIYDTPYISNIHKNFLYTMVQERNSHIITPAVQRAKTKLIENRNNKLDNKFGHLLQSDHPGKDDPQYD